ncbi:uncharacterized protein ARMOST_21770 [Armillaria ostoyae]|uniref:Zinc finger PHD-type domain-containing protein n=1 Tax=Armillaria ostoyae TaxID=47428 RepID=A0A284SB14_ARMOS|nr:uncharacterized protein ARMOST_21770 [Armillaria ostoyae]
MPHNNIIDYDSAFGQPCLMLNEPIATLIHCEQMIFLGIGKVINLHINSESVELVPSDLLMEDTVSVTFQFMELIPTSEEDDPSSKNDWRTKTHLQPICLKVAGRFAQPINPSVSTRSARPCYLFESSILLALGDSLLGRLQPGDSKLIPSTMRTHRFPYQRSGKACFICETDHQPQHLDLGMDTICSSCVPSIPLDPARPHHFLAHIGAHILRNSVSPSTEPCRLCLAPAPLCQFFLTKGKGSQGPTKIDYSTSRGCLNLAVTFKYRIAAASTKTAPCSNVPIQCPLCPPNHPAIWKYSAKYHFMSRHPVADLNQWKHLWEISRAERTAMDKVWDERRKVPKLKGKNKQKKDDLGPLRVSEAHSSRLARRTTDVGDYNEEEATPIDAEMKSSSGDSDNTDDDEVHEEEDFMDEESDSNKDAPSSDIPFKMHNHVDSDIVTAREDVATELCTDMLDGQGPQSSSLTKVQSPEEPLASQLQSPTPPTTLLIAGVAQNDGTNDVADGLPLRRSGRVKRRVIEVEDLRQCYCGSAITEDNRSQSDTVSCSNRGCETVWFHLECLQVDYVPVGWRCNACTKKRGRY